MTDQSVVPALVLLEGGHEDVGGEHGDERVALGLVALLDVPLEERAERVQHGVVAWEE